jgi:uncharacterized protein
MIDHLPIFPLGGVLLPGVSMPLHIFEPRYRRLMHDREHHDPAFGIVLVREGSEVGGGASFYDIGVSASFSARVELPDGRWAIVVRGERRFRVLEVDDVHDYLTARVEWLDEPAGDGDLDALLRETRTSLSRLAVAFGRWLMPDADPTDVIAETSRMVPDDPRAASYAVPAKVQIPQHEKQALLEAPSTAARLRQLVRTLERERTLLVRGGIGPSTVEHAPVSVGLN